MSQLLHIHSIGYTANNNPARARKGGEETEGLIPAPTWHEEIVKRNASVSETVAEMKKLIIQSAWQTKALAAKLLGKDIYTTCGNVWEFLFSHILYKEDDTGKEQLRTPALSWYLRTKRGIDCDDFSIFASTILYNLNIPHYLRIAKYRDKYGIPKDYFQHVYVVVPMKDSNYITIDAVLDEYDAEKPTYETKDFLIMNNSNLNGIDVSVLGGVDDDTLNEISGVLSGTDFDLLENMDGLEGIENVEELEGLGSEEGEAILGAIQNHLLRTRALIRRHPHLIQAVQHPKSFGDMLDYGLKYWDTEHREKALGILADKEDELNALQGIASLSDGTEEAQLFYGVEGLGGISALGRVKTKKGFFKNIKNTVQKVKASVRKTGGKVKAGVKKAGAVAKKVAKKVGKFIIKSNPLTIAARGGMLAAMKTNFMKIASRLKWGYLTEEEAQQHGFDMEEWRKSKTSLTKAEKLFVNTLKGKAEAFKKAILTGRAGGLSGFGDELGVVAAAAAGASLTAAMPFIKKLLELVKIINPGKLLAKVKANKLAKKQKDADTMPEAGEDAESAQPDAPESSTEDEAGSESFMPSSNEDSGGQSASSPSSGGEENSSSPDTPKEELESSSEQNNLPAGKASNLPAGKESGSDEGPVTNAINWVKENKMTVGLVALGSIALIVAAKTMGGSKPSPSLGRRGKGKSRKGKHKNNPPRAISGIGKRKKSKYKNNSRKGKSKGGNPRQVKL